MDKFSIMIGTVLLIVFMFPIIYVLVKQKSKEAKLKNEVKTLASQHGLNIDRFETFGHLSLGLDSNNKKLVVLDPKTEIDHEIIDLKKVNKINLAKRILKDENRKEHIIHLGLEILERDSARLTEIVFYDEDDYESTDAEIRLHEAQKWDDILQKNLAF